MVTEHFVSLKEGTHYYHVHTWSHVFKSAKKLLSSIDALFSDLTTFYSLLFPLKTESNTRKTEKYCLLCRQYYAIQNSTTFTIIIFQSPTLVTGIGVQARISVQGEILLKILTRLKIIQSTCPRRDALESLQKLIFLCT